MACRYAEIAPLLANGPNCERPHRDKIFTPQRLSGKCWDAFGRREWPVSELVGLPPKTGARVVRRPSEF